MPWVLPPPWHLHRDMVEPSKPVSTSAVLSDDLGQTQVERQHPKESMAVLEKYLLQNGQPVH